MMLEQVQAGLNVASGIAGLLGAGGKQRKKTAMEMAAERAAQESLRNKELAGGIARNYDPTAEDKIAFDEANRTAGETARQSLDELNTTFRNSGGSPTGDTLFDFNVRDLTRRAIDPVRMFMAEQASQRTARKLNALNAADAVGGNVFSQYMNLAGAQAVDPTASIAALSAGIKGLVPKDKSGDEVNRVKPRDKQNAG